jgi:hypothetical protein
METVDVGAAGVFIVFLTQSGCEQRTGFGMAFGVDVPAQVAQGATNGALTL